MKGGSFYSVSSSDLTSKYVGDTEKLIRAMFELARNTKPSVVFIDELDSLMGDRSEGSEASKRAVTEFLVQMDGVGNDTEGVLVLGATNLPWMLDSAILRRFQRRIYVDLPSQDAIAYLLQTLMKDSPHTLNQSDFQ
jgi:vacuolar protein-sorting-associated protein 4